MSTIKCVKCGEERDKKVEKCPKCGSYIYTSDLDYSPGKPSVAASPVSAPSRTETTPSKPSVAASPVSAAFKTETIKERYYKAGTRFYDVAANMLTAICVICGLGFILLLSLIIFVLAHIPGF